MRRNRVTNETARDWRGLGFKFGGILAVVLALGACSTLSTAERAFLREKSAEIGSKDVVVFDMRRRAAEKLIAVCLAAPAPVGTSLACVRAALRLVQ